MASITVDISQAQAGLKSIFEKLTDREYLLRPLAIETIANMKLRIHDRGEASDGGQIGSYKANYLKLRQAKYNRNADPKIIVSLTRQLENDWSVLATEANGYGIGFTNPFNTDKARWVEEQKKKIIFNLTTEERDYIRNRLDELVNDAINGA
jgi:hypothetical protein